MNVGIRRSRMGSVGVIAADGNLSVGDGGYPLGYNYDVIPSRLFAVGLRRWHVVLIFRLERALPDELDPWQHVQTMLRGIVVANPYHPAAFTRFAVDVRVVEPVAGSITSAQCGGHGCQCDACI